MVGMFSRAIVIGLVLIISVLARLNMAEKPVSNLQAFGTDIAARAILTAPTPEIAAQLRAFFQEPAPTVKEVAEFKKKFNAKTNPRQRRYYLDKRAKKPKS